MSQRVKQLNKVQDEARVLFKKKNKDYGDAFATYGPIGVIMRIGDKINRLTTVSKSNISLVDDESLRDTLIDLHNYAAMAIMLLDENYEHPRVKSLRGEAKNTAVLETRLPPAHFGRRSWRNKRDDIC